MFNVAKYAFLLIEAHNKQLQLVTFFSVAFSAVQEFLWMQVTP